MDEVPREERFEYLKKKKMSAAVLMLIRVTKDPEWMDKNGLRRDLIDAILAGEFESVLGPNSKAKARLGIKTVTCAIERVPDAPAAPSRDAVWEGMAAKARTMSSTESDQYFESLPEKTASAVRSGFVAMG